MQSLVALACAPIKVRRNSGGTRKLLTSPTQTTVEEGRATYVPPSPLVVGSAASSSGTSPCSGGEADARLAFGTSIKHACHTSEEGCADGCEELSQEQPVKSEREVRDPAQDASSLNDADVLPH